MSEVYNSARRFVYLNARPLDLARWQYHFEGGSAENVLHALSFYQNPDGGFGHGIEADFLNPNSSPMATWAATEILREVGAESGAITDGILRYLGSGAYFDAEHNQWLNCVPTNNDYPHACWWEFNGKDEFKYNPTACLAGFILFHADKTSELYKKACGIAREAFAFLEVNPNLGEQHIIGCFISLYEYCLKSGAELIDMERFRANLISQVNHCICRDTAKWETEYVTRPSEFFNSRDSILYPDNRGLAEYQCEYFVKTQQPDGSYPVAWKWWNDYREFEVSANQWRSQFAVANMLYLKNFGKL